jgi:type IV secretory pathway VirB10-like protein
MNTVLHTPDTDAEAVAVALAALEVVAAKGFLATPQAEGDDRNNTSAGTGDHGRSTPQHRAEPLKETSPSHSAQEPAPQEPTPRDQEDIKPDIRELDAQHPSTGVAAEELEQLRRTPKRPRLDDEPEPEGGKAKTTRLTSCETEESDMNGIEEETEVAVGEEQSDEQSETGKSVGEKVFAPFGVPIGFHLGLDDAHATAMELLITVSGINLSRSLSFHLTAPRNIQ